MTFVPVKPTTKSRYREPGEADEHRTSDYDGRLTCRAENPQHQLSTSQRKHTIATGSDSSDDAGTPFIQSTWLLRIQCKYNGRIVYITLIILFIRANSCFCFSIPTTPEQIHVLFYKLFIIRTKVWNNHETEFGKERKENYSFSVFEVFYRKNIPNQCS